MSNQPKWKCIANLGDASPLEYGGRFLYVDETGIYPPEIEVVETTDDTEDAEQWETHRYILEPCTFVDGVLSDNKFHPDHPAWFADSIDAIAQSNGLRAANLIASLCGDDVIDRACAYQCIESYHGIENFDNYPIQWDSREELEQRYAECV